MAKAIIGSVKFDTLDYLTNEGIIETKDWNDFVAYVFDVFCFDLAHCPPTALFPITDMLEWADYFNRGI